MKLPQRIFLDTSVVNFIVDYSEYIFDRVNVPDNINERIFNDINAIKIIYYYADHNPIEMIVSQTTLQEISATEDAAKKQKLVNYYDELCVHFHYLIDDLEMPGIQTKYYEEYLWDKGLKHLHDAGDRRLIAEAIMCNCDIFCTRDWKTILKHRLLLKEKIPLEILTPMEWYVRYHQQKAY